MKKMFLMFIFVFLSACVVPQQISVKPIELKNKFNVAEAKRLLKDGKNTVKGSALLSQVDGRIQTCAGEEVSLVPFTKYAEERMTYLYGNSERGFRSVENERPLFTPEDTEYYTLWKKTYCDVDGKFEFEKISDGTFFVVTGISWGVQKVIGSGNFARVVVTPEGGALMQKVTVKNGETKKVVLSAN